LILSVGIVRTVKTSKNELRGSVDVCFRHVANGLFDELLHGRNVQSVSGRCRPIDSDVQVLTTGDGLRIDIGGTWDSSEDIGDLAAKRRLGYLPEQPYFYDHLTAEELLTYYGGLFGVPSADRRRRVDALLDEVGIGKQRREPLRKFSKGMLQRVGIAQALINEPELVILDEPMSGLDPLGRRDVRALILRLRDRGCTVFFSSHVLSDAEALCSRVAILAKGRLVASGLLKEMLAFNVRGWELVVADMGNEALAKLGPRVKSAVAIGGGRFQLELPLETQPEQLLVDVVAAGGRLVSLNPIRETLEDLFVEKVEGRA